MLRCISRTVFPVTTKLYSLHIERNFRCDITRLQHHVIQIISLPKIRAMSTEITENMDLSYDDVINLKEKGNIVIIDVRQPDELKESGKIPGSINVPLKELKFALEYLSEEEFQIKYGIPRPRLDAPLVFHCRSGNRSISALKIALELGYKNAKHYKGGFVDWEKHTGIKK